MRARVDLAVGEIDVVDLVGAGHRLDAADLHAFGVARDLEHRHALVLGLLAARAAHEQDVRGLLCVGDPRLLPVDDV